MLFTALIGPWLVDWTSYRETFERRATEYLGRPVTVAGKSELRILPTPLLSFTDVRIGGAGAPEIAVERFAAEVELAALLSGEIKVIHMVLERPHLDIDTAALAHPERLWPGSAAQLDPTRISLAQTEIVEGSIALRDSQAGREWHVTALNAMVEAESLLGPARIEGGLVVDGRPLALRGNIGRAGQDGAVPLNLAVTPAEPAVAVQTTGSLRLRAGEPASYDGTFSLAGVKAENEDEARSALAQLEVAGGFALTPDALDMPELKITYGPEERPLALSGNAQLHLGAEPRFEAAIEARQIDIDRSLGGEGKPVGIEDAAAAVLASLQKLPSSPIPATIRFDAQGVVAGGSVIQAVGGDFTSIPEGWRIDILSAMFPGNTRLDMSGDLLRSEGLTFNGHGRLRSQRPAAFAAWWRGDAGAAARLDSLELEADLALSAGRQTMTNLTASTSADKVRGDIDVRRFMQSNRSVATVKLRAERLDLERGRAAFELIAGKAVAAGSVEQIALNLEADVLSAGGVDARGVMASGELSETGTLKIDRFAVDDVAGARVDASGEIADLFGEPSGRVAARLDAEDLGGATTFLAGLFPESPAVARLKAVAPDLTPLDAEITVAARDGGKGIEATLSGNFAQTQISLNVSGKGRLSDPAAMMGTVSANLTGRDSAKVLRQLGFDALPIDNSGPAKISLEWRGTDTDAADVTLRGSIADVDLAFNGRSSRGEGAPALNGSLELASANVDPALLLAGIALPDIGEGRAVSVRGELNGKPGSFRLDLKEASFDGQPVHGDVAGRWGAGMAFNADLRMSEASLPALVGFLAGTEPGFVDGKWSEKTFAPALPEGTSIDLKLRAGTLDLGMPHPVRNAVLGLRYAERRIEADLTDGDMAGGKLSGTAAATLGGEETQLTVRAALQGASLEEMIWTKDGRAVATGRLDASLDATAQGRSSAGLVATLAGSGAFSLSDATLRSINPLAFDAVIRAADAGLSVERDTIAEAFAGHLDSGSISLDAVSGAFGISSGILRVPTVSVKAGDATVLASGSMDLNALTLASDWSIKREAEAGRPEQSEPQVGLIFEGPLQHPSRRLDVMPLLAYLNIRAFEREVEKVQKLQAEIAERERRTQEMRARREAEERERREAAARAEQEARAKAEAEERAKAEAEERAKAEDEAKAKAAAEARATAEAERKALQQLAEPPRPESAPLDLLPPIDLTPGSTGSNPGAHNVLPDLGTPPPATPGG